jgi:hypothetical protein
VLILHKLILVRFCRFKTSIAFYRHRPASSNVAILFRECGLIPLTIGSIALRVLKLLVTTILYVGALILLFSMMASVKLKSLASALTNPYVFRIDILQHEAHRHPVSCMAMSGSSGINVSFLIALFVGSISKRLESCIY